MTYRLMFRSDSEDGASEIVLAQKMSHFNPAFPAVVSIKAVLKEGAALARALLADELEIEFENRQIATIGARALEELLDFEKEATIKFDFLTAEKTGFDILEADLID